jgi:hypothetical protein
VPPAPAADHPGGGDDMVEQFGEQRRGWFAHLRLALLLASAAVAGAAVSAIAWGILR